MGAREYDPSVGQFISVDPVLDPAQHQSLNGYAYGNNNPVTSADPTGMWIDDGTGHHEPRRDGALPRHRAPPRGRREALIAVAVAVVAVAVVVVMLEAIRPLLLPVRG
ncbi:RHS repeat-associated core domain-containing protein [Streptomyces sp. Ncost-T10-10d]|uniref:RHS repeat-associated core domain-containing protein n=1 Tax=Streptomyces sp. Ncost-T10-10d TaxID=1839774 RepID=UPI003520D85B